MVILDLDDNFLELSTQALVINTLEQYKEVL